VVVGRRTGEPDQFGDLGVHIDHRVHLDAALSPAILGDPPRAPEDILEQAYGGAVEYPDLLFDHRFDSAVRDKMSVGPQKIVVDPPEHRRVPAHVGIGKGAAVGKVPEAEMCGLAREPYHGPGYLAQGTALGKGTEQHAYQMVLGGEALGVPVRIEFLDVPGYRCVVNQGNQLSENGLTIKFISFTHSILSLW